MLENRPIYERQAALTVVVLIVAALVSTVGAETPPTVEWEEWTYSYYAPSSFGDMNVASEEELLPWWADMLEPVGIIIGTALGHAASATWAILTHIGATADYPPILEITIDADRFSPVITLIQNEAYTLICQYSTGVPSMTWAPRTLNLYKEGWEGLFMYWEHVDTINLYAESEENVYYGVLVLKNPIVLTAPGHYEIGLEPFAPIIEFDVVGNDNFSDAFTLNGRSGQAEWSNIVATKESDEPDHANNSGGVSVWGKWTVSTSGTVTFDTFGSNFDTLLAVYTGDSVGDLTEIQANDDAEGGRVQSKVRFQADEGTTYQVAVDGYDGARGSIQLNWSLETAPVLAPPEGVEAQTGLSSGEIVLSWNWSSEAAGYKIFYDEDSINPPFSPLQGGNPASGADVGNVTQVTITGLIPGQIYYCAVKTYNVDGESDYSAHRSTSSGSGGVLPYIISLTPEKGPPGTCMKIAGTDFGDTEGIIRFANGGIGTDVEWSDTTIYCRAPLDNVSGSVQVEAVRQGYGDDFETGDFSADNWQTYGDTDWTVTSDQAHEGVYSVRSGDVTGGKLSYLELSVTIPRPGSVSFYYKATRGAGLRLYIDGVHNMLGGSSPSDWSRLFTEIEAGTHTLTWRCEGFPPHWPNPADENSRCWIDDVKITQRGGGRTFSVTDPVILQVDLANSSGIENGTLEYPFSKIQRGIDATTEGDTVIVSEGEYFEQVKFGGSDANDIILQSTDPFDEGIVAHTIINGGNDRDAPGFPQNRGPTVRFDGQETSRCMLMGLTITGGYGYETSFLAGGGISGKGGVLKPSGDGSMYLEYITTNATIMHCTITGNNGEWHAGGIDECDGLISNCTIADNYGEFHGGGGLSGCDGEITNCTISNNTAERGAGLFGCNASITDCVIRDNRHPRGWGAGGGLSDCNGSVIRCLISGNEARSGGGLYSCDALIRDCTIRDNISYSGGGLYECSGSIENCVISNNTALGLGGGLSTCEGSIENCIISGNRGGIGGGLHAWNEEIRNCIIVGNKASSSGGGISVWGSTEGAIVKNCILWNNKAARGEQVELMQLTDGPPVSLHISHSDLMNGEAEIYWPDQDVTLVWAESNLDSDPRFVNAGYWDPNGTPADANDDFWVNGDYNLQPGSPCIDAADANSAPTADILGNPRHDDPGVENTGIGSPNYVDIGAYEFQGTSPSLIGDFCGVNFGPPDGYVDVWDLMQFADHWHTRTGEDNWDATFDLAGPNFGDPDGYIDVWDLMVFADNWHEGQKP